MRDSNLSAFDAPDSCGSLVDPVSCVFSLAISSFSAAIGGSSTLVVYDGDVDAVWVSASVQVGGTVVDILLLPIY